MSLAQATLVHHEGDGLPAGGAWKWWHDGKGRAIAAIGCPGCGGAFTCTWGVSRGGVALAPTKRGMCCPHCQITRRWMLLDFAEHQPAN